MPAKHVHPLLIRGEELTEQVCIWRLKKHPHKVVGARRGFEVRVYHYPEDGRDPYFVTITSKEGYVMEATHSPTAAAAEAAALAMLSTPRARKITLVQIRPPKRRKWSKRMESVSNSSRPDSSRP
jgi:hypothetical protein